MAKILLIDRDTLSRRAFAKLAEKNERCELVGYAGSRAEAMELIEKYRPQIVVSEIFIGNKNGIDICADIKKKYPEISTYIISDYRNISFMNKALQAGMNNYFVKPFTNNMIAALCPAQYSEVHEDDESIRALLEAVDKKDYKAVYDESKIYVDYLFENMDYNSKKDAVKMLTMILLRMIPGLEHSQQEHYLLKYKMSAKILSNRVYCGCYIMQIATEVFRQLCSIKYSHMNRVIQYIEDNINNEISLTSLAEQANVSSGYLSRIFKKYYKISIVDYIHLRKILLAKQYMVSSEMNISDISFLLGYSEAGYFCKIFKKYESMTPSAFSNIYM